MIFNLGSDILSFRNMRVSGRLLVRVIADLPADQTVVSIGEKS